MKFKLAVYDELKQKVQSLYKKLNLNKYEKTISISKRMVADPISSDPISS